MAVGLRVALVAGAMVLALSCATVIEFQHQIMFCRDVDRFLRVDNATWTQWLQLQPGFIDKEVWTDPTQPYGAPTGNCSVYLMIHWASRTLWKSITPAEMAPVLAKFNTEFGYAPILIPLPTADGFDLKIKAP